ncbi:hypothetical protein WA026_002260 [Henosepilachna vigintioctopunctata]|uniref:CMP/dCMP-type deaminase domain-containing protein n=1 Tax=Henosepilachna vigintioctopunctata TaxID=420089 RepID=A0AAW1TUE4_9CUCU
MLNKVIHSDILQKKRKLDSSKEESTSPTCINGNIKTNYFSEYEQKYMEKAFELANEALQSNEVPVGCIFVYEDNIIAIGRNMVNETRNATRHAEMCCIDQVNDFCKKENLNFIAVFKETFVYVTVEPCIMCAAALYDLKVKSIIYGCKNDRFGGETVFNVADVLKPVTTRKGGYRADDAMNLLKLFYQGVNPSAPSSKLKRKFKETT